MNHIKVETQNCSKVLMKYCEQTANIQPIFVRMKELNVIGLMSGTSLDGLDIVYVRFNFSDGRICYEILNSETIPLPVDLANRIKSVYNGSALELSKIDFEFGYFSGNSVRNFIKQNDITPDLIASHGQTIFHNPTDGYTTQIGKGGCIAALTGIDTVSDFRVTDIALGGQGAPLVPVGDRYLFPEYKQCLNLGGFANISVNGFSGYDIGACNFILNRLAERSGCLYDANGNLARSGELIEDVYDKLSKNPYYQLPAPKSTGAEWAEAEILPLLDSKYTTADLLHTYTLHLSEVIATELNKNGGRVLGSGGGCYNTFLIETIKMQLKDTELVIPDKEILEYKEALIFALLGYLFVCNKINVYSDYTGAVSNSISGCLWKGIQK